jgi:hypothetical protein
LDLAEKFPCVKFDGVADRGDDFDAGHALGGDEAAELACVDSGVEREALFVAGSFAGADVVADVAGCGDDRFGKAL